MDGMRVLYMDPIRWVHAQVFLYLISQYLKSPKKCLQNILWSGSHQKLLNSLVRLLFHQKNGGKLINQMRDDRCVEQW